jgi:hypothetical protein
MFTMCVIKNTFEMCTPFQSYLLPTNRVEKYGRWTRWRWDQDIFENGCSRVKKLAENICGPIIQKVVGKIIFEPLFKSD